MCTLFFTKEHIIEVEMNGLRKFLHGHKSRTNATFSIGTSPNSNFMNGVETINCGVIAQEVDNTRNSMDEMLGSLDEKSYEGVKLVNFSSEALVGVSNEVALWFELQFLLRKYYVLGRKNMEDNVRNSYSFGDMLFGVPLLLQVCHIASFFPTKTAMPHAKFSYSNGATVHHFYDNLVWRGAEAFGLAVTYGLLNWLFLSNQCTVVAVSGGDDDDAPVHATLPDDRLVVHLQECRAHELGFCFAEKGKYWRFKEWNPYILSLPRHCIFFSVDNGTTIQKVIPVGVDHRVPDNDDRTRDDGSGSESSSTFVTRPPPPLHFGDFTWRVQHEDGCIGAHCVCPRVWDR